MHSTAEGFTLIELMIVIAIIGILAMIAIPVYEGYTIQAEVSEGTSLAAGLETAFTDYYDESSVVAKTNAALQITQTITGKYVTSVALSAPGQITVAYGGKADSHITGGTVVWTAYRSANGDISWACNDGTSTTSAIAGPPALTPVGAAAVDGTLSSAGGEGGDLPPICR